jgi:hypothetical protein
MASTSSQQGAEQIDYSPKSEQTCFAGDFEYVGQAVYLFPCDSLVTLVRRSQTQEHLVRSGTSRIRLGRLINSIAAPRLAGGTEEQT